MPERLPLLSRMGALLILFGLLMLGQLALAPAAPACACGAAVTPENARMTGETALITWDGQTQSTDMVLRLGGPASEAAWIMPAPAGTELALGNNDVWGQLLVAVAPRAVSVPDWTPRFDFFTGGRDGVGGGAPGGSGGATVERVVEVGPFRVTTLAGDASAVNEWLQANDYPARPELASTFQSYLNEGWRIQAVRLLPETTGSTFQRNLPPLRMTFATDQVVYPIRLSKHAGDTQRVAIYLAAPNRMEISTDAAPARPIELLYAGWESGRVVGRPAGFTPDGRVFLTAWSGNVPPADFVDDYRFAEAPHDAEFFRTYEVADRTPGRILGAVIVAVPVLAAGVIVVLIVRRARVERPPRRVPPHDRSRSPADDG